MLMQLTVYPHSKRKIEPRRVLLSNLSISRGKAAIKLKA